MMNTGLSFSPTDQSNDPNRPKGSANPVQDAIQLLSFRLPSFLGASSPSPLVGGAPSALGSQIGGGVVEEWLKRFFQGNPAQGPAQRQTPGMPAPDGAKIGIPHNPVIGMPAPAPRMPILPDTPPAAPPAAAPSWPTGVDARWDRNAG